MTSPIDPLRRAAQARRTYRGRVDDSESLHDTDDRSVPAIITGDPVRPTPDHSAEGPSVFSAQLMGQDGQKRGLRGGPETLGAARNIYGATEWSGKADRRARKGSIGKTEI
ncbi:hypothetical protein [Phenylobacterium sp.]|uniref:hypothetical protein n=1 Tax=Phenylobacterium sp. TaxID=1871053 RepID=UPI0030F393DE